MIGAVLRGPGRLEVGKIETPEIGPDEVLVKVGSNIVCSTGVRILRGEKTKGLAQDVVLGHELAGHVAEIGENVRGYAVGASVVMDPIISCRRCYFCRRGMENVCPNLRIVGNAVNGGLSGDTPSEYLALAEPLSCCANGLENHRVELDDAVLVMGAGSIGLFHLQLSLLAGARTVIVSNPSAPRRRLASELGAHVTADSTSEDLAEIVAERTDGIGVEVTIVCVGRPQLVNDAIRLTRKSGRINVFAGLAGEGWAEVEANLIHYNELVVTGASGSRRRDFETALRLIESGRVEVERMVTHRFPLADAAEAIETSAAGGEGIKVAVMP